MSKGKLYELKNEDINIPKDIGRSEGKLYRNLSDYLYWKEGADEGHSIQHEVPDILDEAKKEFPMMDAVFEEHLKDLLFTDKRIILNDYRTAWFKKYFGDE